MATVNILVENDADFYQVFQYTTLASAPIDISGSTMEMMLRRHAEDVEALLRLGTDTGEIVLVDPVNGKFTVLITHAQLQQLPLGDFAQSNIMTLGGLKIKIWSGTLTNNAGPTR